MKVPEFAKLYNSLNKSEAKRFERWLDLKIGVRQKRIKQYLKLWKEGIVQENIFQTLYPTEYAVGDISACNRMARRDRTELRSELSIFLSYLEFENDSEQAKINPYLVRALIKRRLDSLAFKLINKIKLFFNRVLTIRQYQSLYQVEEEYQNHLIKFPSPKRPPNLSQLNRILDEWWVLEKLKLTIFNQNHFQLYKTGVETLLENEVIDLARTLSKRKGSNPLIEGLLKIYDFFSDISHPVQPVIQNFLSIKNHLDIDEQISLFHCVLNRVLTIANKSGKIPDYHALVEVYSWGLKSGYLLIDDLLPTKHFKNYIYTAIKIGDIESVDLAIKKWKDKIPEKEKEMAILLIQASCLFAKKQFSEALKTLNELRPANIGDKFQMRKLIIQSRYELLINSGNPDDEKEMNFLLTTIDSILKFAQRNTRKSERTIINDYIAFFRFVYMLVERSSLEDLEKLMKASIEKENLPSRIWLQEKIEQKIQAKR